MIELNLLPDEAKKKRTKIELPEIPLIPITVVVVGLLAAVQLLVIGLAFFINNQLGFQDKIWRAMAPKKAEFDEIKQSILSTNKKIQAIDSLIEKRFSWSRLLNELSNSLTSNIWLAELSYVEESGGASGGGKAGVLRLKGSALVKGEDATRDIALFIKALKSNNSFFENFKDVELVSMDQGAHAGQDLMNFTIICTFKGRKGV